MTLPSNNPLGPPAQPPDDGRQSERANDIARGVARLMRTHGLVGLPEVTLPNGRRADVMGLSEKGIMWIVEIKSGPADFRADAKWPDYREFCDYFYFAVASDFPLELLPPESLQEWSSGGKVGNRTAMTLQRRNEPVPHTNGISENSQAACAWLQKKKIKGWDWPASARI